MEGWIMWLVSLLRSLEVGDCHACRDRGRRPQRLRRPAFAPRLLALEDRTVPSTFTVENFADSGPGSLRQAVLDANALAGADVICFAPAARDGTITLATGELDITDDLTIDGPGAEAVTVGGSHASRVFEVQAGVTVTIDGMTIRDGLANGSAPTLPSIGGGILNFGNLTLSSVVLSDNQAVGDADTSLLGGVGGARGGGVANLGSGSLTISNSAFTRNQALGADHTVAHSIGTSVGGANGGAITNLATVSISDSQFTNNVARAGSDCTGTLDIVAVGGAIFNNFSLTVTNSTFSHNQAIGGNGSSSVISTGFAAGGAIVSGGNPATGTRRLVVSASTFDHNQAIGGNGNQSSNPPSSPLGPNGAAGGAIHLSGGTVTISGCTIEHNSAIAGTGGAGQNGGLAWGGGLDAFQRFDFGLVVTVSDSTVSHNFAIGGAGGPGGDGGEGWGGGLANLLGAALTVNGCTIEHNLAIGGAGGSGGNGEDGEGGGIFQDGLSTLTLLGATVDHNLALGGAAGVGGSDGEGFGGGLYLEPGGTACADVLTLIFANHATTGNDDVFGTLDVC